MFWRLMEYLFLFVAAILGGRFVYLLWIGKERHHAEQDLHDAVEDAQASVLAKAAADLRKRTHSPEGNTDEPVSGHPS